MKGRGTTQQPIKPWPFPEELILPNGQRIKYSLDNPIFSDFERLPAQFSQFIADPYYLGTSWKNPWPFWKEQGEKFFPLPLKSPYSSLVLLGATGIGKALPNYQGVLTPTGYKPIAEIKVGDLVASNDGKFYPVLGVYPQGKRPVYEFEFNYGRTVRASDEHIWTVSRDGGKSYHNETTIDILQRGYLRKGGSNSTRHIIELPTIKPLELEESQLPVNPYLLGRLIGDKRVSASESKLCEKYSLEDCNEHIPDLYLYSSINQRKSLLDGLFDTTGYISNGDKRIATASRTLALDIKQLAESLGYRASIKNIHKENWIVSIKTLDIIGTLPEKTERQKARNKKLRIVDRIHNIRYIGEEECTCISVAAPNSLFLTEHAIPTHNTSFAVNMIAAYFLHVVLCLRKPQEFFALEEQKNIVFAFLNIVTKTIAYKNAWGMLHRALLKSPFFMEYGHKTQGTKPEWVCDKKPVELLYGSTADQIIGLDIIFCLTGDTEIKTSKGWERLEDLTNKLIQVETFNSKTGKIELSDYCKVIPTKKTRELIEIELEDGSRIRCTPEHKFLLKSGEYKQAQYLTEEDELAEAII